VPNDAVDKSRALLISKGDWDCDCVSRGNAKLKGAVAMAKTFWSTN